LSSPQPQEKYAQKQSVPSRADLLDFGVILACEWSLKNPTNVFIYRFQGMFNANLLNESAVHTESKMIIFTSGLLQGFRLFFR